MTDDFKDIIALLERPDSGAAKVQLTQSARFNALFSPYKCLVQNELGERIIIGHFSFTVARHWEYYGDTKEIAIIVGNHVGSAKNCALLTGGDHFNDRVFNVSTQYSKWFSSSGTTPACFARGPIRIGHGATISQGVIVRSGVTIGNGAVIGAGAVVVDNIPDFAIAVGNPARVIKYRFTPRRIANINKARWWDLKPSRMFVHMDAINNLPEVPVEFPKEDYISGAELMVVGIRKRGRTGFGAEFLGVHRNGQFTPKDKVSRLLQFYYQQMRLPDNEPAYVVEDIFRLENVHV